MKKAMVNVPFDEEKLAAARLYMEQKDLSFEEEMIRAAEALYGKYVPANWGGCTCFVYSQQRYADLI